MKRLIFVGAFLAASAAFAFGVPQHVFCPLDDSSSIWTGQTEFPNGHALYKFRCLQGHEFWVRGD